MYDNYGNHYQHQNAMHDWKHNWKHNWKHGWHRPHSFWSVILTIFFVIIAINFALFAFKVALFLLPFALIAGLIMLAMRGLSRNGNWAGNWGGNWDSSKWSSEFGSKRDEMRAKMRGFMKDMRSEWTQRKEDWRSYMDDNTQDAPAEKAKNDMNSSFGTEPKTKSKNDGSDIFYA